VQLESQKFVSGRVTLAKSAFQVLPFYVMQITMISKDLYDEIDRECRGASSRATQLTRGAFTLPHGHPSVPLRSQVVLVLEVLEI
jgi:hypothetical protein